MPAARNGRSRRSRLPQPRRTVAARAPLRRAAGPAFGGAARAAAVKRVTAAAPGAARATPCVDGANARTAGHRRSAPRTPAPPRCWSSRAPAARGRGRVPISSMCSSEIAKNRFSGCPIDVDHGTILPIPTENAELNLSASSDCCVMLG